MLSEKNSTVVWTEPLNNWIKKIGNGIKTVLLGFVQFYQLYLSSWFGGNCRFYPSCSDYSIDALKERSLLQAICLIFKRLIKCHPFGESGYDPVSYKEET